MTVLLHVDGDAEIDRVICGVRISSRPVRSPTCETRVAVAAEVALVDASVRHAIEDRAPPPARAPGPALPAACSSAIRQLLMLAAARIVSAKCFPVVAIVVVRERGGHTALGHAVCALRGDLQIRPTVTPAFAASIAAQSGAAGTDC